MPRVRGVNEFILAILPYYSSRYVTTKYSVLILFDFNEREDE